MKFTITYELFCDVCDFSEKFEETRQSFIESRYYGHEFKNAQWLPHGWALFQSYLLCPNHQIHIVVIETLDKGISKSLGYPAPRLLIQKEK